MKEMAESGKGKCTGNEAGGTGIKLQKAAGNTEWRELGLGFTFEDPRNVS